MLTTVNAGSLAIKGVSVAGIYTSIQIPQYKCLFDVGIPLRSFAGTRNWFLSHGHVDHSGSLAALLGIRGLMGVQTPPRLFAPQQTIGALKEILKAYEKIQNWPMKAELIGLAPDDEWQLGPSKFVRAFKTHHRVPSLGFAIVDKVKKLRPEFSSLPGQEIAQRKKSGDELFLTEQRTQFVYATDTLASVFESSPWIASSKTLMVECSFFDERKSLADVHAGCHIHLDELIERNTDFQCEHLVLMHPSQLYSPREIRTILAQKCPPEMLEKLVLFAPDSNCWPG